MTTLPTPTTIPTPTPKPFIASATLNIEPVNGDVCGTNFKFRGYITSSGQGSVAYRWKRTDAENVSEALTKLVNECKSTVEKSESRQ